MRAPLCRGRLGAQASSFGHLPEIEFRPNGQEGAAELKTENLLNLSLIVSSEYLLLTSLQD